MYWKRVAVCELAQNNELKCQKGQRTLLGLTENTTVKGWVWRNIWLVVMHSHHTGWDGGGQAGYTLDRSRTNEPNLNNCMSLDLGGSCGVPGENWSKHMIIYLLLANIFSLFLIKSTEYTFQWYFQKQSKLDDLFSSLRMIQNERLQFSI